MTGAELVARLLLFAVVAVVGVSIVAALVSALRADLRQRRRGR